MANRSRHIAAFLFVLTAGAWLAGCSMPDTTKAASDAEPALEAGAQMVLDHTASAITIDNKTDRKLISVRIELQVAETELPYVYTAVSIEKGETAAFDLSKFKTDAADLLVDPSSVHPKQITAKARDSFGRSHEATAPW